MELSSDSPVFRLMSAEPLDASLPLAAGLLLLLLRSRLSARYRALQTLLCALLCYRSLAQPPPLSALDALALLLRRLPLPRALLALAADLCGLALLGLALRSVLRLRALLRTDSPSALLTSLAYDWFLRHIPYVRRQVEVEQSKLEAELEGKDGLRTRGRGLGVAYHRLPAKGVPAEELLAFLGAQVQREDAGWARGRVSGAVYLGDAAHTALLNKAFGLYSLANPLHPDTWPSVMKLEAEVVAMTAGLVSADCATVCGSTTSGGTESIVLAVKAHRDFYRSERGVTEPELVCGVSAHAAVDKACALLGVRLIKVPLDAHFCVSVEHVRRALSANTILLYASAPSFAQGAVDPVQELGKLARDWGVGLHVDCCLGGFVLPFAARLGVRVPPFDFGCAGVSSMSIDTHKYGCALKGSSVLLFRTPALRQSQYFCFGDWTGGLYTTPTLAGSRSGGLIAQCWASLLALGEDRFCALAADVLRTTRLVAEGVARIEGLRVLGRAEAMVVCFASAEPMLSVYAVVDAMLRRGWALNSLQRPACAHVCVTALHVGREQELLDALALSVSEARACPSSGGSAAVYGATASLPPGPVNEMLKTYNDVVLKP